MATGCKYRHALAHITYGTNCPICVTYIYSFSLMLFAQLCECSFNFVQVPELWARVAYPSLKPLGSWVRDYQERITFMRSWLTTGLPKTFWLPGFFSPQGLMTGALQAHARKHGIAIDSLSFAFQVSDLENPAEVVDAPEDGILIHGLWLEGAKWRNGCLTEPSPDVMCSPLPVIHLKPVQDYVAPDTEYACPLYKTSGRAGAMSTTGQSTNFVLCVSLPVREGTDRDYWILQGVALLYVE